MTNEELSEKLTYCAQAPQDLMGLFEKQKAINMEVARLLDHHQAQIAYQHKALQVVIDVDNDQSKEGSR